MFGAAPYAGLPYAADENFRVFVDGRASVTASLDFVLYAATREFATGGSDTPPNRPFTGSLRLPIQFTRSILGSDIGQFTTGDGDAEIDNTDGSYDFLTQTYGIDGREIIVKIGRPGLATAYASAFTIFRGVGAAWNVDEKTLAITLRDRGYRLNVPAQSTLYGGTGDDDGGADLAQKRKPRAFGYVLNVSPPLVTPKLLIYQVNDGPVNDITAVYDRGSALTGGSDYNTYADLAAASTAGGTFDTCLAEGFFKLGSSPAGTVTADVEGDATGSSFVTTAADIVRRLLGETDLVDPEDISTYAFSALNTLQPAPIGYWLGPDDTPSVADVVANIMASIGGWAGFNREGLFEVRRFDAPGSSFVASFDGTDLIGAPNQALRREPLPGSFNPPPWRWRVAYQRAWTQQTDLAGSVSATRKAFVGTPYRLAEANDTVVKVNHPLAQDPAPVEAYFRDESDALAEAQRRLALYRANRSLYRMQLPRRFLQRNVGDVIHGTYGRWDLTVGRTMRIVEMTDRVAIGAGTVDAVEVVAYG